MNYSFRAECDIDVSEFFELLERNGKPFKVLNRQHQYFQNGERMPDMDVELQTSLSLEDIINFMKQIDDGHIMWQTVDLSENYTGERDHSR